MKFSVFEKHPITQISTLPHAEFSAPPATAAIAPKANRAANLAAPQTLLSTRGIGDFVAVREIVAAGRDRAAKSSRLDWQC